MKLVATVPLPAPSHYVELFGTRVHYQEAGTGEPVLLIHGLGGSTLSWLHNIEPLGAAFHVYAVDMPGHGLSDRASMRANLPNGTRYLKAFLDALGLDSVFVVGNSVGGLLAMRLAVEHPERVKRLVLVDSAGLGRELALFLRLMSLPLLGEAMSRPSHKAAQALVNFLLYDPSLAPTVLIDALVATRKLPGRRETMLQALRSGANVRGQKRSVIQLRHLPSMRAPTLVLWGANDRLLPVSHGAAAKERIPGALLHVFPGCGHWPQLEKAAEFNALLADFLAARGNGLATAPSAEAAP